MAWVYLILAGLLEVGWTFGLKESKGFTVLVPSVITIVLIIISFMLLARVMRYIEIGTAYAIFTGIGTVGTVILGIALGDSADPLKLMFLGILVIGIVGLKLVSGDKAEDKTDNSDSTTRDGISLSASEAASGKERA
ncbi:DMT family transporter [Paenibacillus radicis (ex Gao et al. 2016)]|uniref:QacE family quaternary ammonium compound efflux SMR transporter n=1 Tax=Paenibacillus radicis (ex Gao et al. 2016) TaxID=1737354 RepID=A0A917M952_9BACL|nr:multidrug efflux SMR transporter [Paenibacillus radicis (ex Gao et al. 2016)]GGG85310.1 QacE family quaternary ammonium compound efflux SMR transporter [Paenibacillus radicis (ex Gao et al. 2016)]